MRAFCLTSLFCIAIFFSCDKKDKPVHDLPDDPPPKPDTGFKCGSIPPPATVFGWEDSTINEDRNVNTFIRNPANPDEIIFVVNGDIYGFNKLYTIHIPTRNIRFLGNMGDYLPRVNKQGWIIYSNVDNNIVKIKANGDSATQLTFMNVSHDPRWDYTGNYFYYFEEAHFNTHGQLVKANSKGINVLGLPTDMAHTAVFNNSDKIIYQRPVDKSVTLIQRNMANYEEKALITGPYDPGGKPHFANLCLDSKDQNFYWSNSYGIFRCNLTTLKTDTVYRNCENLKHLNPLISFRPNELTYCTHTIKPINQFKLFHTYKAMELNLVSKQVIEVKIFP